MRTRLALALVFVSVVPIHALEWLPLEQAMTRARAESRPIFVDVMAPWCGFCRKMREQVFPTREFQEAASSFVLARVNADEDLSARKYNVEGLPTLLMLDHNGYLIGRSDGFTEPERLVRLMKEALGRAGTQAKVEKDARERPGVNSSYRAGLYYASINDSPRARSHFLNAWQAGKAKPDPQSFDALYNAAVSSMEMKDYSGAVQLWSQYVDLYPSRDRDFAYARYFRGLALRSLGKKEEAKADMAYASNNLPPGEDKNAAIRMAGK